jgi:thiol:disulfide interchange protein
MKLILAILGLTFLGACSTRPEVPQSQVDSLFIQFKPGLLHSLIDAKKPAFVHITGKQCIVCQEEWGDVDKTKLQAEAERLGFLTYEYNIGEDWPQILKEVSKYGVFGVPAYLFVDKTGNVSVLYSISDEMDLIKKMQELS